MIDKPITLLTYALIGLMLCLYPTWLSLRPARQQIPSRTRYADQVAQLGCIGFLAGCFWFSHGADSINLSIVIVAISAVASMVRGRFDQTMFTIILAVLFATRTLPWWRQVEGPLYLDNLEALEIAAIFLAGLVLVGDRLWRAKTVDAIDRVSASSGRWILFLIYGVGVGVVSFSTETSRLPGNAYIAWHHWSAYLAPVELLRSGAVIFRDFPAQYGLGPTLTIAALCGSNCWAVMPMLSACSLFALCLAIAALAMLVTPGAGVLKTSIILVVVGAACLLWAGYPPELTVPVLAPSGSGMRFLPVLLLTLFLVAIDRRVVEKRMRRLGHALWLVCVFWSPESAFYATFVWGPYYLWVQTRFSAGGSATFLRRRGVIALAVLAALLSSEIAIFLLAYFGWYHTLPTAYGFFAYIIDEPIPLDMSVRGVVWVLLAVYAIAVLALRHALKIDADRVVCRQLFIVTCTSFAVTSIFIGRSHDNNFLNLMPMTVVTLIAAAEAVDSIYVRRACHVLLVSTLAYLPLCGWDGWREAVGAAERQGWASAFEQDALLQQLSYTTDEGQQVLDFHRPSWLTKVNTHDARRAIDYITSTYHEPITVYDVNLLMINGPASKPWNAIQNTGNFLVLPHPRRIPFIVSTAQRLKRPGWFLINRIFKSRGLLDDMEVAYSISDRLDFDTYYAVRYVPK